MAGCTRVLFVCSVSRCRSPLAAAILIAALADARIEAEVHAAALRSTRRGVTTEAAGAARRRGLDISSHRSLPIDAQSVADTDLILGMERAHVRAVVALDPRTWPRTFTLKELVRSATAVGPRGPDESLADWLDRVGAGRSTRDLLGASSDDDIADPTGGTPVEHEELAFELEDLIGRLVPLAWPR